MGIRRLDVTYLGVAIRDGHYMGINRLAITGHNRCALYGNKAPGRNRYLGVAVTDGNIDLLLRGCVICCCFFHVVL